MINEILKITIHLEALFTTQSSNLVCNVDVTHVGSIKIIIIKSKKNIITCLLIIKKIKNIILI